jgi:glycosylphosphatidylinositol transamidase (GPIT) subunit GPI8
MTVAISFKQLYETDDYLWLLETVELLKQKKFNELDLENLIEELESMGKRDLNKAKSLLRQIIIHFLLIQYWQLESERNYHHWRGEIKTFRYDLNNHLTTNLKNKLQEDLINIYQSAIDFVQEKTEFSVNFPQECPYTLEQLLLD